MLPIERLIKNVGRMTCGRERAQLEIALTEALLDLLQLDGVNLYKCQEIAGEVFVWLAVEAKKTGTQLHDDGLSKPNNAISVDRLPLLKTFFETGLQQEGDCRTLLPILNADSSYYGFVEIPDQTLDLAQLSSTAELVVVFKNVLALLDYSEIDTLTGLLNRKTFDEYLKRILLSVARPSDSSLAARHLPRRQQAPATTTDHWLGVIDIDHFKRVNDGFGHSIGDEVLLLVATMMKASFRGYDRLFRFGGEEFVVLLKPTESKHAQIAFDRFRESIEARNFPLVGRVTVSIGFARIGPDDPPAAIFERADEALYWVKEHGRNQACKYEALIDSGALRRKTVKVNAEFY